MGNSKEFSGKSIDEAIQEACEYYDLPREKLEIEILSDAKAGIFGLVGSKKASIQVKLIEDPSELRKILVNIVERLAAPIVGPVRMEIEIESDRARVTIQTDCDPGLLIGRDGQTLAAIQYLANRILNKRWPQPIRVQVDAGDYREQQEDLLRQHALELANRAKSVGRPQSTKPLSSYHRRIIHLALQEDQAINTRSKGDGPLKRVLILPKRERQQPQRSSE